MYQRSGDGYHLPFIPRLYNRRIDALDRIAQFVEVTADQLVIRKLVVQHIEELHQSRGYVLWLAHIQAPWN